MDTQGIRKVEPIPNDRFGLICTQRDELERDLFVISYIVTVFSPNLYYTLIL
ncbi:hypothetical protein [Pedobacter heparinus]|uniref:Uncharacterized protein n=1 Tax=Pedobacter heparinus (strain ATCC 13125 / DSM 2366 / CIP 104194 / JCM 7457 / NBRC 12017 / NCIMB 9290 / NRRL B-14731 / HIM 762-3) TaxID=485917 RepID=C6Y1Q5_PEDHD|nr:hypothetical protein [Pedobacter heparinus]ACU05047.1 hypothetical protein Phep_2848 [Pedobacter heparinus DSM 2366]